MLIFKVINHILNSICFLQIKKKTTCPLQLIRLSPSQICYSTCARMQNTTQKSIHPVRNRFNQTGNNTSNSEGRENIKASTRLSPFHSIPKSSREPGTTKSSISSEANQERFFPLVSGEIYIGRKKNPLWSAFFSSFQRATLPNWTLLRKKKNSKLPFFFSVSSRPREMNKWNWNLPADPRQQQQKKKMIESRFQIGDDLRRRRPEREKRI